MQVRSFQPDSTTIGLIFKFPAGADSVSEKDAPDIHILTAFAA